MLKLLARFKGRQARSSDTQLNSKSGNIEDIFGVGFDSSAQPVSLYTEELPHVIDFVREAYLSLNNLKQNILSFFPFIQWLPSYNLSWLMGDLIAGITTGVVVVPQGMAYAILANLPPQYGLYTSFIGVLLYWIFATSKDVSIGPVSVSSVFVGKIISEAKISNPEVPSPVIASALALICGLIIFSIGFLRCGWIIVIIPLISTSAYATGSAITIAVGQVPVLLGIRGVESSTSAYNIFIGILRSLSKIRLDAAIGFSSLFLLYAVRSSCTFASKRVPSKQKLFFFISTLRTVIVILLCTMISWLVNRNRRETPLFRIISNIPRGFTATKVPVLNTSLLSIFRKNIPAMTIIILIEHIAIAKSFGRINGYTINPSQEMLAIGISNIFGPFLGAFPATGSFSRAAILSKAGVRTPLAGIITSSIVLLSIFALPSVFYYVPSSALSAVIIHSVLDLITPPSTVYQYWRVSPFEVPIFFGGVLVTLFCSIELGIYTTIGASFILFICRFIKAKGRFLGNVKSYLITGDSVISDGSKNALLYENSFSNGANEPASGKLVRYIFPPLDNSDGTNPEIKIQPPKAGIYVFCFSDNFNYLNADHYLDQLTNHILANTRRTNIDFYTQPGDRPWNEPKPRKKDTQNNTEKPTLKAIILDFSSVNHVDITSIQQLVDVRKQLDRYASPSTVEWHFSNINNRWTKRALVAAGFGYPKIETNASPKWKAVVNFAELTSPKIDQNLLEKGQNCKSQDQVIDSGDVVELENNSGQRLATISGLNYPLFHPDLLSAWQNAVINLDKDQD